jgi:predicted DCC family thiol-disulfide oxidoreductase YuxK
MAYDNAKICVYFDGACPSCVKDRDKYLRLAGKAGQDIEWLDITHKNDELIALGIDPDKAVKELHISIKSNDQDTHIISELDAYIVLMRRTTLLSPLAWLIGLPIIRPILSDLYQWLVLRRLTKTGRYVE